MVVIADYPGVINYRVAHDNYAIASDSPLYLCIILKNQNLKIRKNN